MPCARCCSRYLEAVATKIEFLSSVSCNLMWWHVVQTRCCDGDRLGEQAVLLGGGDTSGREVRKGLTEEVTCDLESE